MFIIHRLTSCVAASSQPIALSNKSKTNLGGPVGVVALKADEDPYEIGVESLAYVSFKDHSCSQRVNVFQKAYFQCRIRRISHPAQIARLA